MNNPEKLLATLPKNKLGRKADLKIKFQLYRLIWLQRFAGIFDFSRGQLLNLNRGWALAIIVVIALGSTSIYAYASNDVLPGNQLYPLKIVLEKIEQNIAIDKTAKIANLEKVSSRRLREAVELSQKNSDSDKTKGAINEKIKNSIAIEVSNHEKVSDHIKNLSNDNEIKSSIEKAKKNDEREINYLNKIAEYAQENNDQEILDKANNAKEIIIKQEYKHKEGRMNKEATTTEEVTPSSDKEDQSFEPDKNETSTPFRQGDRERERQEKKEDR